MQSNIKRFIRIFFSITNFFPLFFIWNKIKVTLAKIKKNINLKCPNVPLKVSLLIILALSNASWSLVILLSPTSSGNKIIWVIKSLIETFVIEKYNNKKTIDTSEPAKKKLSFYFSLISKILLKK